MNKLKKAFACILSIALVATLAVGCGGNSEGSSSSGEKTKVSKIAILLPGPITDESWNQGAYEGLKSLEKQGYEIAYTEDVQAADMESVFRSYCNEGFGFVIGHGVQYGDACIRVAEDFPDTYFFITDNPPAGTATTPANIAFYDYM